MENPSNSRMRNPVTRDNYVELTREKFNQRYLLGIEELEETRMEALNQALAIISTVAVEVTFASAAEIISYILSNLWIKVILCILGLIISGIGLFLVISNINNIIHDYELRDRSNEFLMSDLNGFGDLDDWLTKLKTKKEKTLINNTAYFPVNKQQNISKSLSV
jgi:hypothetical protein